MAEQKFGVVDPAVELFKRLARLDNLSAHHEARDRIISVHEIHMALADQIKAPRERHRAEFRKIVGTDEHGSVTKARLDEIAQKAGVTIAAGGMDILLALLNQDSPSAPKTTKA